jgi:hypothetical protein
LLCTSSVFRRTTALAASVDILFLSVFGSNGALQHHVSGYGTRIDIPVRLRAAMSSCVCMASATEY